MAASQLWPPRCSDASVGLLGDICKKIGALHCFSLPVPVIVGECQHEALSPEHAKAYSDELAKDLSAEDVRKSWPRQRCLDCGTTLYASYGHYIAGDW